jgi:hypothetical protein
MRWRRIGGRGDTLGSPAAAEAGRSEPRRRSCGEGWVGAATEETRGCLRLRPGTYARHSILLKSYLMRIPEIAREMTRRWISEVPSKMV